MPSLFLDLNLEKEEKSALKEVLNLFYNNYKTIYDISISLDKGEKTVEQSSIELMNLEEANKEEIESFNSLFAVLRDTEVIYTKIYLNTLLDYLEDLNNESTASSTYSGKIKETYFKIIYAYIQLKTELDKN